MEDLIETAPHHILTVFHSLGLQIPPLPPTCLSENPISGCCPESQSFPAPLKSEAFFTQMLNLNPINLHLDITIGNTKQQNRSIVHISGHSWADVRTNIRTPAGKKQLLGEERKKHNDFNLELNFLWLLLYGTQEEWLFDTSTSAWKASLSNNPAVHVGTFNKYVQVSCASL